MFKSILTTLLTATTFVSLVNAQAGPVTCPTINDLQNARIVKNEPVAYDPLKYSIQMSPILTQDTNNQTKHKWFTFTNISSETKVDDFMSSDMMKGGIYANSPIQAEKTLKHLLAGGMTITDPKPDETNVIHFCEYFLPTRHFWQHSPILIAETIDNDLY